MVLKKIFPFMDWFKSYNSESLRLDAISGLTVALVLIPQSMAYAQLAGLPAYHGLYASFLPPMTAALFGSGREVGHRSGCSRLIDDSYRHIMKAPGKNSVLFKPFAGLLIKNKKNKETP